VEWRWINNKITIVAVIETGRWERVKFSEHQKNVALQVAMALKVPAYFVEYKIDFSDSSNTTFEVTELSESDKTSLGPFILSEEDYKQFIKTIGRIPDALSEIRNRQIAGNASGLDAWI